MFKTIQWKTFPRDFIVIQIGFALFGLSIALLIQANLGTSPWAVLTVALAQLSGLTPGMLTVLIGLTVLTFAVILQEGIGWGTLSNILFIGPWLDLALWLIPSVTGKLPLQIAMFLAALVLMGMATAIYISVDAGAGPRDSLMLALKRTRGWSVRRARIIIEVTVVLIGWLLGGPAGIGTVVFALLIGIFVQWGFKLFNVSIHHSVESEVTI
jgi:uncharacterized membrane protein YczE